MKVEVVCFGAVRDFMPDHAGRGEFEVADEATVGDVVDRIGAPRKLVYALLVNGERASFETPVAEADEVTVMPPFSGGADGRCEWAGSDPLMVEYHDTEWGVPEHDDRRLFEFLVLEGAQAGLSWSTILNKREGYRRAFDGFDPAKVARYTDKRIQKLLADAGIVRNRAKVAAAVTNARAFLEVQEEFGSFDSYVWGFVDGKPIQNRFESMSDLPAETDASRTLSKDLKKRGFKFVGPTICYAHMQATGMVNDHVVGCRRHSELAG